MLRESRFPFVAYAQKFIFFAPVPVLLHEVSEVVKDDRKANHVSDFFASI